MSRGARGATLQQTSPCTAPETGYDDWKGQKCGEKYRRIGTPEGNRERPMKNWLLRAKSGVLASVSRVHQGREEQLWGRLWEEQQQACGKHETDEEVGVFTMETTAHNSTYWHRHWLFLYKPTKKSTYTLRTLPPPPMLPTFFCLFLIHWVLLGC